jgi:uncharacterized protein YbjT (DUF2867 family)
MILITTGAGKVGQHVVTQLAQKKVPARAGFHTQAKASALREPGIEGVVLDFDSPESLKAAFKGIDTLFLVTPGSPDQGRQDENLLAEAKRSGVKRVVKLSGKTSERATAGFSLWNRDNERRIKETGIPYTILRGNYFMQNLLTIADQIKAGAFTLGPAHLRPALIDTRDIAAMLVAALTEEGHAGKIYEVNGQEALNGHEQAVVISRVLGRPVKYIDVTVDEFVEQLKKIGMPDWMIGAFRVVATADPKDRGEQSSADVERVLHRKPGTFEQFIKDHRVAFQP